MNDDFTRVVIEEVRDASMTILVPTIEVKLVGETHGTSIAWHTHMIKVSSKK